MNSKNGRVAKKVVQQFRCPVYTRKSTEGDGLEQEFNSLDAQREAGEAFVKSQVAEGWECLPDRYDDGGFTGGNMERPVVQPLLADIEADRRAQTGLDAVNDAEKNWHDVNKRRQQAQSKYETLQATVGAQVDEVVSLLTAARERHNQIREERETVARRSVDARVAIETAKVSITQLQSEIARHAADRESAIQELLKVSASRLLSIAVPHVDVDGSNVLPPSRAVEVARMVELSLKDVDDDQSAWERVQKNIHSSLQDLMTALRDYRPAIAQRDELLIVTATFHGREAGVAELDDALSGEIAHRERILNEREREVLENHLVDEVAAHLHERIHDAEQVVRQMSDEVSKRLMSTGMKLRFRWRLTEEGDPGLKEARQRLLGTSGTWSIADRQALGEFLHRRIRDARARDAAGTWHEHLVQALDYRRWHHMQIERRQDERWVPLTKRTHGTGSGGEKTVALFIPQFAAAPAHYTSADPLSPRIVLLDERPTTPTRIAVRARTATRSSSASWRPTGSAIIATNLFRLYLHTVALNLLVRLRRHVADPPPEDPSEKLPREARRRFFNRRRERDPLDEGQACTWRMRLIKVAARVVSRSRIVVQLSGSWPHLEHYRRVSEQVLRFTSPALDSG